MCGVTGGWETKAAGAGRWGVFGDQRKSLSSVLARRMPSGRRQRVTDIPAGLGTVLGIQLSFKPHTHSEEFL